MEIDERTRRHLKEIFETIEKRKYTFGKAFVGVAFEKNEKNELRVFYGLVSFLRKGDAPIQKTTYDYGRFVLSKKSVEISEAVFYFGVIGATNECEVLEKAWKDRHHKRAIEEFIEAWLKRKMRKGKLQPMII